jgi:hypothetical protein
VPIIFSWCGDVTKLSVVALLGGQQYPAKKPTALHQTMGVRGFGQ